MKERNKNEQKQKIKAHSCIVHVVGGVYLVKLSNIMKRSDAKRRLRYIGLTWSVCKIPGGS